MQINTCYGTDERMNKGNIKLTRCYPRTDWNTPLVFKDCKDTDEVFYTRLQFMNSGCCLVSWHGELHVQAPTAGGDVGDEVLVDDILMLPFQIYRFICYVRHSQLSWRRH